MNYRVLPKTSLQISEIGFGCMSLDHQDSTQQELIRSAFDSGINYFDTADLYDRGQNEQLVGRAVRDFRKEIILATKVGNEWLPDGSGWRWNPTKSYILKAVDKSLERLQTDYIDLYQLHGGTIDDSMDEVVGAFEMLQQMGKIRHYGLSSIRPNVIRPYAEHTEMVSDMLQYSLLDRRPEEEVLDQMHLHGVGVMVRGALAKGLLAGKPPLAYMNHSENAVQQLAEALHVMSGEGRSMGQLAIRYVLTHPAVTSAVIGIRTTAQLQAALGTVDVQLTPSEVELLRELIPALKYTDHR